MVYTCYIDNNELHGTGISEVGQVRKVNEDNCGYAETPNGYLFVVCDGMGGHVGGATASRIAVNSIINYVQQHQSDDKRLLLKEAIQFANMQILGEASTNPELNGMGTTACTVLIDGINAWIAHVGDSRIYLYEAASKQLFRITKDHSLVQALVDKGELDDRDAEHHPQKNIILRALGTKETVEPEVESQPVNAASSDIFLICSDGLSGMVDDNEIEQTLQTGKRMEVLVQDLVAQADAPGKGKDNITAQLVQVVNSPVTKSVHPNYNPKWRQPSSTFKKMAATSTRGLPRWAWLAIGICVGISITISIFFTIWSFTHHDKNPETLPKEPVTDTFKAGGTEKIDATTDKLLFKEDTLYVLKNGSIRLRDYLNQGDERLNLSFITDNDCITLDAAGCLFAKRKDTAIVSVQVKGDDKSKCSVVVIVKTETPKKNTPMPSPSTNPKDTTANPQNNNL